MFEQMNQAQRRLRQITLARFALAATVLLAAGIGAGAKSKGQPVDMNHGNRHAAGAVYTMTNAASGNAILAFNRAADGTLAAGGTYATGGMGTGSGLGSQGAIALSEDHRWLLAVNAGSNDVSVFRVKKNGLALTDRVASGGIMPISVAVNDDLVYVLNAGGTANVTGFTLDHGSLSVLSGSTRNLSAAIPGPAQVGITPDGNALVVTEKATNLVDTFALDRDGYATAMQTFPSPGAVPFGFALSDDYLFVTEAGGLGPGNSSTTAYDVAKNGTLSVISASVTTHHDAACWAVVTPNGRYLYTADAHSGVISGYAIAEDGSITLLNANGIAANTGTGSAPLDMATSHNGRYLYALVPNMGAIQGYAIGSNGALAPISGITGIPASAAGLVAW